MQRCPIDLLLQWGASWLRGLEVMEKWGPISGGSVLQRPRGVSRVAAAFGVLRAPRCFPSSGGAERGKGGCRHHLAGKG